MLRCGPDIVPKDHVHEFEMMSTAQSSPGCEGAGPEVEIEPHSTAKPRVALACQRCKRRKQRCDGNNPACKSCLKAKTICTYEVPMRVRYPEGKSRYINALEERIAMLEASMPEHSEDHMSRDERVMAQAGCTSDGHAGLGDLDALPQDQRHRDEDQQHRDEDQSTLVDGVAFLSLSASGIDSVDSEPYYLGSSSGAIIARLLQASVFQNRESHSPSGITNRSSFASQFTGNSCNNKVQSSVKDDTRDLPSLPIAAILLRLFFEKLHTRWPLLDREAYETLFEQHWRHGVPLSSLHNTMFHLIFAISARFQQLTRQHCALEPELHLEAAVSAIDVVLKQHSLFTMQYICLLAVHGQRSPFGAGSWSQIRYAVTLAIDLGLHRREVRGRSDLTARDMELRRRVFWSCYCLDRMTSITLGRSFAISDRDINAEMPSQSIDTLDLTELASIPSLEPVWTNILPFIHITKLCKIQSRIHRLVFRVDKSIMSLDREGKSRLEYKLANIGQELDVWATTIPKSPRNAEKTTWMYDNEASYHDSSDYFNLQYHKTLLMLFTALLPGLKPGDSRIKAGAQSAIAICMTYKRLHQQKILTYTTIALHSCFVAGLTLVYCLRRDSTLFDYSALEATHACTQVLTIFAEKWLGAAKYRDIFDSLSGRLLRELISKQQHQHADNVHEHLPSTGFVLEKEALDEVHEDAPGGWQAWTMLNEMIGNDLDFDTRDFPVHSFKVAGAGDEQGMYV